MIGIKEYLSLAFKEPPPASSSPSPPPCFQLVKRGALTGLVSILVFIAPFSPAQGEHYQYVNTKFTRPVDEIRKSTFNTWGGGGAPLEGRQRRKTNSVSRSSNTLLLSLLPSLFPSFLLNSFGEGTKPLLLPSFQSSTHVPR